MDCAQSSPLRVNFLAREMWLPPDKRCIKHSPTSCHILTNYSQKKLFFSRHIPSIQSKSVNTVMLRQMDSLLVLKRQ